MKTERTTGEGAPAGITPQAVERAIEEEEQADAAGGRGGDGERPIDNPPRP